MSDFRYFKATKTKKRLSTPTYMTLVLIKTDPNGGKNEPSKAGGEKEFQRAKPKVLDALLE